MSWKKRPAVIGTDMADDKAQAISRLCHFEREKEVEWPCPKCGSYNVVNYDPGISEYVAKTAAGMTAETAVMINTISK